MTIYKYKVLQLSKKQKFSYKVQPIFKIFKKVSLIYLKNLNFVFNIFFKIVLISISILVKKLVSQSTCSTNSTKGAQEFEPKPLGLNTITKKPLNIGCNQNLTNTVG